MTDQTIGHISFYFHPGKAAQTAWRFCDTLKKSPAQRQGIFCILERLRGKEGRAGAQNRPVIRPSSVTSMLTAAGVLGRPGMVMMLPQMTTTKPAPAARRVSSSRVLAAAGL